MYWKFGFATSKLKSALPYDCVLLCKLQQELLAIKQQQELIEKEQKLEQQRQEQELERHRREQLPPIRSKERSRESKICLAKAHISAGLHHLSPDYPLEITFIKT